MDNEEETEKRDGSKEQELIEPFDTLDNRTTLDDVSEILRMYGSIKGEIIS